MKLPNFLIVGAAKCGTTSLYEYLKQHPEVFMPKRKEPNYFVEDPFHKNRVTEEQYKALFTKVSDEKAIGEASVAYLYDITAPEKIFNYLGAEIRIVIILRNPVDMAYSLWGHMIRAGGEKLPFLAALEMGRERIKSEKYRRDLIGWIYSYAYIDRAKYAIQVERYIQKFGPSNVRILVYEEFFKNPESSFRELCRFLGVSANFTPKFKVHNPTGPPISMFIRDIVNQRRPWKEPIKLLMPPSTRRWLKTKIYRLNRRNDIPLPALSAREREKVWNLFDEDVVRLERTLRRSLRGVWRKESGESLRQRHMNRSSLEQGVRG